MYFKKISESTEFQVVIVTLPPHTNVIMQILPTSSIDPQKIKHDALHRNIQNNLNACQRTLRLDKRRFWFEIKLILWCLRDEICYYGI